jgi:hypothetical protein
MARQKNQVEVICENCKKTFSVKASLVGSYRYCGFGCRTDAKAMTTQCLNCGKEINTYKKNPAKYCSISCGLSARNRTEQNPSYHRDVSGDKNPMFGKGQSGAANGMFGKTREKSPAWRGGKKIRKDGYILVAAPAGHPCAIDGIYILEHRLVMEKIIGRYLDPKEVVHHLDCNPSNNVAANLILLPTQTEHIHHHHRSSLGCLSS